jgi:hypothetical protein
MTVSIANMSQVWMSNTNTFNAIAMSVSTMGYGSSSNSKLLNLSVDGNSKFSVYTNGSIYANGSIVQVQSYTYTQYWTTTSHGGPGIPGGASGSITPVYVSITPRLSTSKILVVCNTMPTWNAGNQTWLGKILRTGAYVGAAYSPGTTNTNYPNWSAQAYAQTASTVIIPTAMIQWLDSPVTNGLLTYALMIAGNNNNTTPVGINGADINGYNSYGGISTITAYEIAQ